MSTLYTVVVGIVVFVIAALALRPVGRLLKEQVVWTWAVGIVVFLVAIAMLVLGQTKGPDWLWGAGIGLGLGGLSGLRYGEGTLLSMLGGAKNKPAAPKEPPRG